MGAVLVPDALTDFGEPITHTGLTYQALIRGEEPNHTST